MTPSTAQQQAQKAADAHPDAWIAVNEGDSIEGEIIDVSSAWSDQRGGDYPLITVRTADGAEKKIHCFSTVLYNEAIRQRPIPGERLTVTFLGVGEAKVRGRSGAKRYRFRIEGRSAAQVESLYDRMAGQQRPTGTAPAGGGAGAPPPGDAGVDPTDEDIPF